jgi:hypothetical protein
VGENIIKDFVCHDFVVASYLLILIPLLTPDILGGDLTLRIFAVFVILNIVPETSVVDPEPKLIAGSRY